MNCGERTIAEHVIHGKKGWRNAVQYSTRELYFKGFVVSLSPPQRNIISIQQKKMDNFDYECFNQVNIFSRKNQSTMIRNSAISFVQGPVLHLIIFMCQKAMSTLEYKCQAFQVQIVK